MARNRYYQGPPTDHFDGVRFFNPGQPSTDRGLTAMLRWKLAGGAAKWPVSVPVTPAKPEARVAGLRIIMVGHASLLIQAAQEHSDRSGLVRARQSLRLRRAEAGDRARDCV